MATAGTLRSSWTTTTTSSSVRPWRSSKFFSTSCQLFLSGEHAETLKKQCFTDAKKTNCLEAIKFVANLVWNGEANFASLLDFDSQHHPPQSTRRSRPTATLTSRAPWSTWTSSTPSSSASTLPTRSRSWTCPTTPGRGSLSCKSCRI